MLEFTEVGTSIRLLRVCISAIFLLCMAGVVYAQSSDSAQPADMTGADSAAASPNEAMPRGSIPADLLRPRRDEAPRYPVDMVIGPLGRGDASPEAYSFASRVASDLVAADAEAASLGAMNSVSLEGYLSTLEPIGPRNFRLGGGRLEDDGAVSFLVRFIGREQAITGELYIRMRESGADENASAQPEWLFEDLILDNARSREEEIQQGEQRFDFPPYERIF